MRRDTLYISDMDGTLLDDNATVSPVTASIISRLSADGAMFTVATARTPASVDVLMQSTHTTLPAIVMTGAALWDRTTRRYADLRLMDADNVTAIRDTFAQHGVNPFIYTVPDNSNILDVYHTRRMNSAEQLFYDPRSSLALKRFILDREPHVYDRVILFFGTGDATRITAVADRLRQRGGCSVSCYPDTYNRDVALLEVFAPDVSKAIAVRDMAERCDARRIVVFGDNLNDLPMMRSADVAVAVDNALPSVRDAADIVIGPNTADSVARFIELD